MHNPAVRLWHPLITLFAGLRPARKRRKRGTPSRSRQRASPSALPFALLLALMVCVLVASAIGAFAKKIPTAGFAYTFNTHGFGKRGGFMSGWILAFSYTMVGPMLLAAIGELTSQFLQTQWNLHIPWWLFTIAFALILWGIGMLGISRSATTALVFLVLEVGVMLALFATIFAKGGAQGVSFAPFNPANSLGGLSGLGIGLLWGILYFVGFESAGTLGEETRNARSSIPVALFTAATVIGVYYVLSGWAAAIGFGSSHVNAFVNDSSPWITLTQTCWGSGFVWLVSLTALNSIFANLINLALIVFYRRDYPAEFSIVRHGILPVIASVIMLLPIYGLLWPMPAYPNNLVPYIMLVWIVLGGIYLYLIVSRRPDLLEAMGRVMVKEQPPRGEQEPATDTAPTHMAEGSSTTVTSLVLLLGRWLDQTGTKHATIASSTFRRSSRLSTNMWSCDRATDVRLGTQHCSAIERKCK